MTLSGLTRGAARLARCWHWLVEGVWLPAITLPAPALPRFTTTRTGDTMKLTFSALAALADGLSYRLTVAPASGQPIVQSLASAAAPVVANVPAGPFTITLEVLDSAGDVISPATTRAARTEDAPAITSYTVSADDPAPVTPPAPAN